MCLNLTVKIRIKKEHYRIEETQQTGEAFMSIKKKFIIGARMQMES